MSRWIDAEWLKSRVHDVLLANGAIHGCVDKLDLIEAPSLDIVQCKDCKKSHIDGKTTHYLWCTEWGRSTDVFGYCERGEREGE